MSPWFRRTLLTSCVIVAFVVLAGATYQGVATALERRRFPHPGRLIDVGGHQLHLYCAGQGAPTVILEAPATAMSAAWAWVQTDTVTITRACSYDRAGLGWSEAGDAPFAPQAVPAELSTLLQRAGERGPYVVVGAELGAAFATLFAAQYPDDTAALVLVNPPGRFQNTNISSVSPRFLALSPWLARTGVLRATGALSNRAAGLPESAAASLSAFLNRPDHLTRAAIELSQWNATVSRADAAALRRKLPVTQVELEGSERVGLLSDRKNAQDVAKAVARAVEGVRGRR